MQPEFLSIRYDASDDTFAVVSTDNKTQTVWCLGASHPTIGQWIHVAAVLDARQIALFVNGVQECAEDIAVLGDVGFNEALTFGNKQGGFDSFRLDDVLIHNIAKSPDYLYRRAHPGVPTVRFLAHTTPVADASGRFPWLDYGLAWANEGAIQNSPLYIGLDGSTCAGLLSPCLGYAGWWRFDEGSGTVAIDASTNRLHGSTLGSPGWRAGLAGPALAFDGVDDRVMLPPAALNGATDVTFEAACLREGTQSAPTVLSAANASYNNELTLMWLDTTSRWSAYVRDSLAMPTTELLGAVATGTWEPVALSRGGATLSIASASLGTASNTGLTGPLMVATDGLQLGTDQDSLNGGFQGHQWWKGAMDSVRLMSRALTPDERLHYPMATWEAGVPSVWIFEAEDVPGGLWHTEGRLDGDGWAFSPTLDTTAGRLYGPDETGIPAGSHQAVFRVQSKTGAFAQVATLEVYDTDAATVLATKTLYRSSFAWDLTYQDFSLPFTNVAGHRLQFRVLFSDTEFLKVDKVKVK